MKMGVKPDDSVVLAPTLKVDEIMKRFQKIK
jgi:hypothetical protein